jgi:hypothetical protein
MARPSPRTQGVDAEGNVFQKFGTQQLSYVEPPVKGTTFQGVTERDVGKNFQALTTALASPFRGKPSSTAFSQQFQSGITGHQRSVSRDVAIQMQDEKLRNMGLPSFDFSNLNLPSFPPPADATNGENGTGQCVEDDPFCGFTELLGGAKCKCPNWFGWEDIGEERGCECEACKNGTGQCSDKVPQCDAWDVGCEVTGGKVEDTFFWIKIILAVIGIGVLLWLLKPLFNMITAGRKAQAIKTVYEN